MKEQIISEIIRNMLPHLDNAQLKQLQETLQYCFWNIEVRAIDTKEKPKEKLTNEELLELFIAAKRVEGCSEKTVRYYRITIEKMLQTLNCPIVHIQTEDLRKYLSEYQQKSQCSKSNIDNIRRILSSFFSWLEDENYVLKSPVRRIHKIRTAKTVKET